MKCLKIQISGRVQGVWFRASTQRKANELGVKGIVKNLDNGDVYVEAEGNENQLKDFIDWCWVGSELSKVVGVEVNELEEKGFKDFRIVRG